LIVLLVTCTFLTLRLHRLPKHHRDPFDRLLVCQALARRMPILTPDRLIRRYSVTTIW
jgi:PIN domain nuclease of toxin-antitoxin system